MLQRADIVRNSKRWTFFGKLSIKTRARCRRVSREFGWRSSWTWKKTRCTSGAGRHLTRIETEKSSSLCLCQSTIWVTSKSLKSSSTSEWSCATETKLLSRGEMARETGSPKTRSCRVSSSFACRSKTTKTSSIPPQNYSLTSKMKSCLTQLKRREVSLATKKIIRWLSTLYWRRRAL